MRDFTQIISDRGFATHLGVYAMVNFLLFAIDVSTSPGKMWFYWPLLGWGAGILAHGFLVYRSLPKS
jgi:hypothetical protein